MTISTEYRQYLQSSPKWDDLRRTALRQAGYRCERCGAKAPLQAHHLTYKNIFNERPGDLQALCFPCHRWVHMIWWQKTGILTVKVIKWIIKLVLNGAISLFAVVSQKLIH